MIQIGNKSITAIHAFGKVITAVYAGTRLVWQAVTGMFASRFWIDNELWNNNDFWLEK